MSNSRIGTFLITCSALLWACSLATTIEYDANAMIINGERRLIISGAIHYPRSTPQMWPDLMKKAKDGGLDAIETYIFWDLHEPARRQYDFSGNIDFIKFIKNAQEEGLYVLLRIGPYVCAEWNYGGFPLWLHNLPGIQLRTDNAVFKEEMQIFTTKIVNMCKEAGLFASQGGPIILAQIENEYGDVISHYGEAGNAYIKWCAQMALAQNIGVPWIMCKQSNAPASMINTCNGYYCDNFKPNNPKSPKMFTENWVGWFQKWGERRPHRTAQDVAFSVARFFQSGGVLQNYYMYHGGTNFGRTAGGPYIITAYDYDAPLDEYGNLNQPKWGHLKDLHAAIKLGEKVLTNGTITQKQYGDSVYLTTYANNASGEKFCFLSNSHNFHDAEVDLQQDGKYYVPAWSVSILQDCKKEVFNTAKVNSQTTVYVKKPAIEDNSLSWIWTSDPMEDDTLQGQGTFKASQLLEQKGVTVDASDYLWYMTKVLINDTSSWHNATLQVNTTGHVLHSYVNGQYIGAQWGTHDNLGFVYEKPIALKQGTNVISLLSGTVGNAHYGAYFDMKETGIVGGPVKLIASNSSNTLDLSKSSWSYKVGLSGETKRFYDPQILNGDQWDTNSVAIGKPMTWYKTTFKTPGGKDSIVLDFQGLGKGQAWVNGQSIGRYWPTMVADKNGCSDTCDYRGNYEPGKCASGCGEPSQRFYHVPRSFLNIDTNTLVLFEEMGGTPFNVSVQTVTSGPICATADYGRTLEVRCPDGKTISEIQFASYGDPQGKCGSFQKGEWESRYSMAVVERACIGKQSCSVNVTSSTFEIRKGGINGQLAVQLLCDGSDPEGVRVQRVHV